MSGTRGPIFKQAFIAGAERSVGSCAGGGGELRSGAGRRGGRCQPPRFTSRQRGVICTMTSQRLWLAFVGNPLIRPVCMANT